MGKKSPYAPRLGEILPLIDRGLGIVQISERLGFPKAAFQSFCQRLGLKSKFGKRLPKARFDHQEMIRLLETLTQAEVAARLGVQVDTISRRLKHLGLQSARTGPRAGSGHRDWKNGRMLDKHGYVLIFAPLHPAARNHGYVSEHRLVMECCLGRCLSTLEVVNHVDNHPRHNWPENLTLFASNADHLRHELTGRAKSTPRRSIPGAYGSSEKLSHCPDRPETLALCSSKIRARLAWMIESYRPTRAHQSLPKRAFLRAGAWRDPFQ